MAKSNYLQGGLENLNLISDDVWDIFDYDTEFKDVFSNISRRESLISHRFYSVSSADILSDLQYIVTQDNISVTPNNETFENIFNGEIFQLKDEINNGIQTGSNLGLSCGENLIENAYLEDIKTVGCGRQQQAEVNITYNNAFDPRLTFAGLGEEQCFLDDLEQDISVQQNVYMSVEDVADIVDEYYNNYRSFLNDLGCSHKKRQKYIKQILSAQPPNLSSSPPKLFDIKTCWINKEERHLAKQIDSEQVRSIWKQLLSHPISDQSQCTKAEASTADSHSGSLFEVQTMTPSPHVETQKGRTPCRQEQWSGMEQRSTVTHQDSDLMSIPPRNAREEVWGGVRKCDEAPNPKYMNADVSGEGVNWQNLPSSVQQERSKRSNVQFDLEIVNGNVKILTRDLDVEAGRQLRTRDEHGIQCNESSKCRNTSKASSDTAVCMEEGRIIPVLTSCRYHSKDRAKPMRSESTLTKVETSFPGNQKTSYSPQQSPRETSISSFAEGSLRPQTPAESPYPVRGRSEIFPQTQFVSDHFINISNGVHKISEEKQREPRHSRSYTTEETVDEVPHRDDSLASDFNLLNTLKQYGWYGDNYDQKQLTENVSDSSGVSWPYSLGQICDVNPYPQPSVASQSQSCSKRQLFKSPSPIKRYGNNVVEGWNQSPRKPGSFAGSYLPRSRSVSPVKRHALHNGSFNSQWSSPNMDSTLSSVITNSPEPQKTSSQLNAACEPFIPAHLMAQENSRQISPTKNTHDFFSKQVNCQSPNKDALKKLLQSPEVLVPFVASNDAKQAYLIQQKQHQMLQKPAQPPLHLAAKATPVFSRATVFHTQPHSQPTTTIVPTSQTNLPHRDSIIAVSHTAANVLGQKPQHPHISFTQQLQLSRPPPLIRTNTLIPQWSYPPSAPPPSRPLGVNIAFQDPRPRPIPLSQRYAPPLLTWQAFPSYPPQARIIHPTVFNFNNNSNYDDHGYTTNSYDCLASYNDHVDNDKLETSAPAPPARNARPIRANPANLIHISTK